MSAFTGRERRLSPWSAISKLISATKKELQNAVFNRRTSADPNRGVVGPSTTSPSSSISQHLRAAKTILQDVSFDGNIANTALDETEIHTLEQDALEVLRLIRSQTRRVAPINRIPPKVLALIPDFWDKDISDQDAIALTHVCRAWREIFTSRTSLWTNFDCQDADKTRVYLDRSGSSPINVRLERAESLSPYDPFLQVVPQAIGRLQSLVIRGTPENLPDIAAHLSRPAPLLEYLLIDGGCISDPERNPMLTIALFNGDLSSLRELRLHSVCTSLPWRNMVNLTSFTLDHTSFIMGYMSSGDSSVGHLLDFVESAPRLREIELRSATPTSGSQEGRLVPLPCLERMDIVGGGPPSLLFDHLLIPVGAKIQVDSPIALHLNKSFDGLRDLYGFRIHLHAREFYPRMQFSGPHWQLNMVPATPRPSTTCRVLESLAQFDPMNAERLRIAGGDLLLRDGCTIYGVIFHMKNLRTLTASRCKNLPFLINTLSDGVICPNLEELILDPRVEEEKFDIQGVIDMATKRAKKSGAKLRSVRIVSRDKSVQETALKLKEHIAHVECNPRVALLSDNIDSDEEED